MNEPRPSPLPRSSSPRGWGAGPLALAPIAAIISGLVAPVACMNNDDNRALPPVVIALSVATPARYDTGDTQIYEVQQPVRLPMRRPTDDEQKALGRSPPYPRAPFLVAGDVRIEVRFTMSNLDDEPHNVELLVDPWNEFARYRPGAVEDQQTVTPNLSGVDKLFFVPPKSRIEGTLTPDDMRELSVDLATAMSILENPPGAEAGPGAGALINRAMSSQNRSSGFDPLLSQYIPSIVPGLTGFDLGLRSTTPVNVALEVFVDVTDLNGDRMATTTGGERLFAVPGRAIEPPPPPRN